MRKITELTFDNTYAALPEEFYQEIEPTPFKNPHLVTFNPAAAEFICLNPKEAEKREFVEYFSGRKKIPGSYPIAMYYSGHQFGVYNPDLGDGRAILLGEVRNSDGKKWDLHLKGAGRTKYSRQFDGRAVLRSTIREYLCSGAMNALGIPTTRALCIVGSNEKVEREKTETAAMMVRLAESHVRFGMFEGFHRRRREDSVKLLADYVIEQHFSHLNNKSDKYRMFLAEIAERTAKLIALWQAYGFVHGVMNTDNMSVLGLTLDYGPYGFMEEFNPEYTPNHSDSFGRYAYHNQPGIAFWNLKKLAQSMSSLVPEGEAMGIVENYRNAYKKHYLSIMRRKLGIKEDRKEDGDLIRELLDTMQKGKVDYTNFFRKLSTFTPNEIGNNQNIRDSFEDRDTFDDWSVKYSERISSENSDYKERKELMNSVNPKYVLRNYLAQKAIERATEFSDYTEITRLQTLLKNPFDDQPDMEEYAEPAPEWSRNLVISCSS